MSFFNNLSIKNKIISTILIVSTLTMIIGFSILGYSDIKSLKKEMHQNALMNTRLIGEYSIAPLTFDDNQGAKNILSKLSAISEIRSGVLYDRNGILFASYKKSEDIFLPPLYENPDELTNVNSEFTKYNLKINYPIVYNDYKYGIIVIDVDSSVLNQKIRKYILVILAIFVGMTMFSFILANQFQKPISQPILKLAKLTRKISEQGSYDVQIKHNSDDEIGVLYDDFNYMLQQIVSREEARDEAEKKLQKEKDRAEESDRLKSAFLANMSHEIRTPMNAILGFTELLTMPDSEVTPDEKENFIKLINNSGSNLLQLIDDIIDISKIEASQLKIIKKDFNLNANLKNIHKSYQEIKKQKSRENIDIKVNDNVLEENISIHTDPLRLDQVFTNLIDNALKFTEDGFIEFGYEIQNNKTLLFYVKDTGVGMSQDKKDTIFDRFTKLEDATRLYRGAGLGLAISKSIVELLGGKLWVESIPNFGSTFYFTLPFTKVSGSNEYIKAAEADLTYNWEDKTILIAEDEPANIIYIEEVLKITKAKILKARNGKEALQLVSENNDIDIIIMDIKMPEMDGLEATKRIKQINKDIPIISQSAYAMPADINQGLSSGMSDYLVKPVKPKALLSVLHKHLTRLSQTG